MLYSLSLNSDVCKLYLNKTGEKIDKRLKSALFKSWIEYPGLTC